MTAVSLGLRANALQFSLLVALNGLVGAMVGLERSVLPLVGEDKFGLSSTGAILTFVVAFGLAKALANLAAGRLAGAGRKRLLVAGWLLALPVPALIGLAPNWSFVVVANALLGASQGLAWSMTVLMKIDLAGPSRRGLALGLNESAGYVGLAVTAFITGALAATVAPQMLIAALGAAIVVLGAAASAAFVRDTIEHVALDQRMHGALGAAAMGRAPVRESLRDPTLRAWSQAGLVNNLNDALVWGVAPLFLASHGATAGEIGAVAALYPAVWGVGQLGAGWLSDVIGRKPLIVAGMLAQAGALGLLVASGGSFAPALAAAALLGFGTALAYPTLIAAVSDTVAPRHRASAVGAYRFWRDIGFVVGAVLAGLVADTAGNGPAIAVVAVLTAASGLWAAGAPPAKPHVPLPGWGSPPPASRRRRYQRKTHQGVSKA